MPRGAVDGLQRSTRPSPESKDTQAAVHGHNGAADSRALEAPERGIDDAALREHFAEGAYVQKPKRAPEFEAGCDDVAADRRTGSKSTVRRPVEDAMRAGSFGLRGQAWLAATDVQ